MDKFNMSKMKGFAKETVSLEEAVSNDRTERNLRALMEHEEAFLTFIENVQKSGDEGYTKAAAINMVYQTLLTAYRNGSDTLTFYCSKERYPAFLPEALKTAGIRRFRYVEEPNSAVFEKFEAEGFRFIREAVLTSDSESLSKEQSFDEDALLEDDLEDVLEELK
jgi:hypothetical protein